MATRMQQRRGTAAQWSSADPILAAGEIGFETDTNKFKIGDGVNHWEDLTYYASAAEIAALVDGAPDLLNTLNELAAAIGNDANFADTLQQAADLAEDNANTYATGLVGTHNQDTTDVHGIADTSLLATKSYADAAGENAASDHAVVTTSVHGIADTSLLATMEYSDNAVDTHAADTTNVHGIADTAQLATKEYADGAVGTHTSDTTSVHGIADTSKLVLDTDLSAHASDTTSVHGISDTANLVYASDLSGHASDTTNVHGITDTADLATKSYADTAEADAITAAGTAADTKISTAVAALTKSSVGLGNVDNTSDANKPVSTATQTALDLKAPKAAPTFTGTLTAADVTISGNLTVSGTTTTVNTTNFTTADPLIYLGEGNNANLVDLGFVGSYNDGTYAHQGLAKDSSDGKWKLFKGVTDEPTTTVNFSQGSLDALKVGAFEATTVTPSSGVVFSDGTQTKEGVPSRTPIIQKTASYTLSALTERDSLVEVASSSATTVTIPADSAVNFPIGTSIDVLQTSTGQVTIAGAGGVTVNATPGLKLRTTWSSATLFKRAANTWVVYGDLMA